MAYRLALATLGATCVLILLGGLVTNTGAALAVPDWPSTFGYNMVLFPWSRMVGGILYAVGGVLNDVELPTVEAYDPATDTWTTKARMPTPRSALATAVMDGRLYALGGFILGQGIGTTVEAYDAAVRLSSLGVDDLIALLVHPPRPPANELGQWLARTDPAWWVKTVQVWACLGLLHHRSEQPWATSTRRRLLVDIAWGVEDWTTEAALFALVAAAWGDPAIRADVARIVTERLVDLADVNRSRTVTIAWSVATLAKRTPGLSEGARELRPNRDVADTRSPTDPQAAAARDVRPVPGVHRARDEPARPLVIGL